MSKDILFVCTGNTCRSPMAEGIYNLFSAVRAESAGISAGIPSGAAKNACIAAMELGADISAHISSKLTTEDLEEYSLIVTMTESQKNMLQAYTRNGKIMTLAEFAGEDGDVYDPYGGDIELYRSTAEQIRKYTLKGILKRSNCVYADISDTEKIAEMEAEIFTDSWSENSVKTQIENGKVIAVKYNEDILGYCIFMIAADEGEILRIAVNSKLRKSGFGKKLILKAISEMKESGCDSIYLEVRAGNIGAESLYKAVGFEEIGIRKNYYRDNGEDAVLYKKEIKER